jgi:hypothetical protein
MRWRMKLTLPRPWRHKVAVYQLRMFFLSNLLGRREAIALYNCLQRLGFCPEYGQDHVPPHAEKSGKSHLLMVSICTLRCWLMLFSASQLLHWLHFWTHFSRKGCSSYLVPHLFSDTYLALHQLTGLGKRLLLVLEGKLWQVERQ